MTDGTRLWLPPASPADAEAAVGMIVEDWAGAWFVAAPALQVRQSPASALAGLAWRGTPDIHIGSDESGCARMGASVCAGQGDPENARDAALLREVGQEACENLVVLLGGSETDQSSSIRRTEDTPTPDETSFLITALGEPWSIGLALKADALTLIRRRTSEGGPSLEPGSLTAALANERCALALHLGEAQLSASELAALGKGDVIAFDCRTTEPVPVVVAGNVCETGSARIEGGANGLRAAIVTPISLKARKTLPA